MAKGKAAATSVRIPQSKEEATEMISAYGEAAREIALIELAMTEQMDAIKKKAEADAAAYKTRASELFKGLQIYCEANRQALLGTSGVKTADLGTGKVSWRFKPAKVSLSGEVDDIVDRIAAKALDASAREDVAAAASYRAFLRVSTEVDKEAMLKNPDLARTIDGVRIGSSGEVFEIEAFTAELAEAAQ